MRQVESAGLVTVYIGGIDMRRLNNLEERISDVGWADITSGIYIRCKERKDGE